MTSRFTVGAADGMWADIQSHGGLASLNWGETRVSMYSANALETPLATPWLRLHEGDVVTAVHPLLGPASGSRVATSDGRLVVQGQWGGVAYRAELILGGRTWAWSIELASDAAHTLDVVAVQDVSLAPPWLVRMNEFYGAQYLDVTPLEHPGVGTVVAVRQNQRFEGTNPWLVMVATDPVVGYATDLLDLSGLGERAGLVHSGLFEPMLASRRLQHEHTLVALQVAPIPLVPGRPHRLAVGGLVVPDHPEVTGESDLAHAEELLRWERECLDRVASLAEGRAASLAEGRDASLAGGRAAPPADGKHVVPTLFSPPSILPATEAPRLPDVEHATYAERDEQGLLSYFLGDDHHIATRRKELGLLRPHAHLLRTGGQWSPQESALTTTTFMAGGFASYLTQGHVSKDRMVSAPRGYLGHHRAAGLRAFVEVDGTWQLLDTPSVWQVRPGSVCWTYVTDRHEIDVRTSAPTDEHTVTVDLVVRSQEPVRVLFALNLAFDGDDGLGPYTPVRTDSHTRTVLAPPSGSFLARRRPGGALVVERTGAAAQVPLGDDGVLFADGASRGLPWVSVATAPTSHAGLRLSATLVPEPIEVGPGDFWGQVLGDLDIEVPDGEAGQQVNRLAHVLPWFVNNALTHYLSPRGIEQHSGGGWGTRDVCQGPVEMLLALGRHSELRELLLRVLASQARSGEWAQAFEIFDVDRHGPGGDAHGDVIFWPLLAVGRYLQATGDASFLTEDVPFYTGAPGAERATVAEHLRRAIDRASTLVVPGTSLTAYGHGDWNDSLQPADPAMKEGMTSSWTVTLHHQALTTLAAGLECAGFDGPPHTEDLRGHADRIRAEFRDNLMPDGVVAGYGLQEPDGSFRYLLHPRDHETGLTYSVLPMIHAIIDGLFSHEEALAHADLITEHLLMPDGVHLFDRPPRYRGGPMVHFQRAESASFFGREIGTMYTHAHLRYTEAMARLGRGPDLLHALDVINPVDTRAAAPNARRRQATSYFSSSDAVVPDRYAATEQWEQVVDGEIEVEGGWRVYSSGPGIALRIVVECLLGITRRADVVVIDPVLVPGLDGLRVRLPLWGTPVQVRFAVGPRGHGPTALRVNGHDLPAERETNPYREGGLLVRRTDLQPHLDPGVVLDVEIP